MSDNFGGKRKSKKSRKSNPKKKTKSSVPRAKRIRRKSMKKSMFEPVELVEKPVELVKKHLNPREFFQEPVVKESFESFEQTFDPVLENIHEKSESKIVDFNASDSDKVVRVLARLYSKDLAGYVGKIVGNITREVNMDHRTEHEINSLVKKELIKSIKLL